MVAYTKALAFTIVKVSLQLGCAMPSGCMRMKAKAVGEGELSEISEDNGQHVPANPSSFFLGTISLLVSPKRRRNRKEY